MQMTTSNHTELMLSPDEVREAIIDWVTKTYPVQIPENASVDPLVDDQQSDFYRIKGVTVCWNDEDADTIPRNAAAASE